MEREVCTERQKGRLKHSGRKKEREREREHEVSRFQALLNEKIEVKALGTQKETKARCAPVDAE